MPMLHQHDHTLRMKHQRALQLLPWAQDLEGFPGGSDGKESAYIVGDLGSIPGSGRSLGCSMSMRELIFLKRTLLNPQDCCAASQQAVVLTFL